MQVLMKASVFSGHCALNRSLHYRELCTINRSNKGTKGLNETVEKDVPDYRSRINRMLALY